MRASQRLAAGLAVAGLVTAACGARLTPSQRTQALSYGGGGGGGGTTTGAGGTGGTVGGTTGAVGGTTGAVAGTTGAVPSGTTGGSATGSTGSSTGGTTGAVTGPTDWTKVPPGGNGGATDVGVTANSITVANISDVSGAVPGLFEDARFAVQAYFKYFNARYPGGIYGRHINVEALDAQLDTGANRSASIQACNETFAGVGSVSAFDQGAAPVIASCKSKGGYFPDLRGLATTDEIKAVANVFPVNAAGTGGTRGLAQFAWAKEHFPDAIKKAAYVYSDGEVTRQLAQQDEDGTTKVLGFHWVDDIPIGTTETNYAPFAQQIKTSGDLYVTFVGAYQQAANLALALSQIGWMSHIQVYQPTVTAYTPDFITQAGSSIQGGNTYIAVTSSLNEEIASNPELALYAQWLNQVKPGAHPTNIGQFAWGAAALFVQQMIAVGPRPTRGALLARIPAIHSFGDNGLFPPQDVGGRRLGDCVVLVQVKGSAFVRYLPSSGFRCKDGVWNTKTQQLGPGYPQ